MSVSPSVSPSLNISENALRIFLIFCMKLVHHKGTKVTEPDFWKKILGVANWGKPPFFGHFWCFLPISLHSVIESFWNIIHMISSTLCNTQRKSYVQENSGSGCRDQSGAAERVRVVRNIPHHFFHKLKFLKLKKFWGNNVSEDVPQMHSL